MDIQTQAVDELSDKTVEGLDSKLQVLFKAVRQEGVELPADFAAQKGMGSTSRSFAGVLARVSRKIASQTTGQKDSAQWRKISRHFELAAQNCRQGRK